MVLCFHFSSLFFLFLIFNFLNLLIYFTCIPLFAFPTFLFPLQLIFNICWTELTNGSAFLRVDDSSGERESPCYKAWVSRGPHLLFLERFPSSSGLVSGIRHLLGHMHLLHPPGQMAYVLCPGMCLDWAMGEVSGEAERAWICPRSGKHRVNVLPWKALQSQELWPKSFLLTAEMGQRPNNGTISVYW